MSIERIISDNLNLKESDITDNKKFIEDLNADSLSIVEILMSIEEEFDIEIPDEDANELLTVGEMKQYIVDNS
jgi:acyl carrier protein